MCSASWWWERIGKHEEGGRSDCKISYPLCHFVLVVSQVALGPEVSGFQDLRSLLFGGDGKGLDGELNGQIKVSENGACGGAVGWNLVPPRDGGFF